MSATRASIRPCLACSIVLAASVLPALPVAARSVSSAVEDVVGFRGPHRDGSFPGSLPHRRPQALWTFATGAPIEAAPIWVDGAIVVGSGDGNLYAVDGATGAERWRFAAGPPVDGPAASAGGLVFVESRDATLHAVDATTGRERWRLAIGPDAPHQWGWDYFLSGPQVSGGRLYVGAPSGDVLAVAPATGKVLWRFHTGGRVRASPTVDGGAVYVGSFDGFLYALDAATGALRWKFVTDGSGRDLEKEGYDRRSVQSSAAVTPDLVVVGCRDGFLYGVDRATGKQRWSQDHHQSWVVGSPAIAGDRAIVGSSDGRFVQAVELATGKELWHTRTESNALSSPAVAGDVALIGELYGNLLALDVATGRELWRFHTGEFVNSSPLVRDGRIYVGSGDGKLYAIGGDLAAPASRTWRAVYYDAKAPARQFQGDRAVRDALAAESYRVLNRLELAPFLAARIADGQPSVVVVATDDVPTSVLDERNGGMLLRRYLDAGGRLVWLGAEPLLLHFDAETLSVPELDVEAVRRARRDLGVAVSRVFEGLQQAIPTDLGRAWGLPAQWWAQDPELADGEGFEVLAADPHGHASSWLRRYTNGGAFIRYWGRDMPLPDVAPVRALAEHDMP